jgi:hypothetical protein
MSHAHKQILIIHFEGVIGNLAFERFHVTSEVEEVNLRLYLRQDSL